MLIIFKLITKGEIYHLGLLSIFTSFKCFEIAINLKHMVNFSLNICLLNGGMTIIQLNLLKFEAYNFCIETSKCCFYIILHQNLLLATSSNTVQFFKVKKCLVYKCSTNICNIFESNL